MLYIIRMANDAIGAANLDARMVLRAASARPVEQRYAQRPDGQKPPGHSVRKKHDFLQG